MTVLPRLRQLVACLSLIAFVAGCSEMGPEAEGPFTIRVVSGNQQVVPQGELLPAPIVVEVRDAAGDGVADVPITVLLVKGDGRVEPGERMTGPDGQLSLQWRLGDDREHAFRVKLSDGQTSQANVTAKTTFRYVSPDAISDGWPTSALDPNAARTQAILEGVDDMRDGVYTKVHSMLVVHEGQLIFETYFPGQDSQGNSFNFDRDTPHEAQSATKSFRSTMMGIAIDKGFVDGVGQSIASLFPQHAALFTGTKQDITVADVLTMSSGLNWDEVTSTSGANTLSTMYSLPATQWDDYVFGRPMRDTPGTRWEYNTGASIQLNPMVMSASGMSMAAFVKQYYSDLVESPTVPGIGYPLGARILPRDMAKLGQVFLDDGMWKTTRVVSSEWVEQSTQARFPVSGQTSYGYQWWTRSYSTLTGTYDAFYAAGNGGQFIIVVDALDLVVVFTGGHFGSGEADQVHALMERRILRAFES